MSCFEFMPARTTVTNDPTVGKEGKPRAGTYCYSSRKFACAASLNFTVDWLCCKTQK